MSPRSSKTDPQILEIPSQLMAEVTGKGPPDKVFTELMPALYGSVYTLKFGLKKQGSASFKVSPPRARYPGIERLPKEEWTIIIGIPVPDDTTTLPQKVPGTEVKLTTWDYGTTAQILHIGTYDTEGPTIERLLRHVADNGYEVAGPHEEEYLTKPDSKVVKTVIRFQVKKQS